MKFDNWLIIIIFFIVTPCNAQLDLFYPEKHDSLTEKEYNFTIQALKDSYKKRDSHLIAFALLQLKEKPKFVYKLMDDAIVDNPERCCGTIHYINDTYYVKGKPKINRKLYPDLDSIYTNLLLEKCKILMDSTDYRAHTKMVETRVYDQKPIKYVKKKVDHEIKDLKNKLYLIHSHDMVYRGLIGANKKISKKLNHLQNEIDLENQRLLIDLLEEDFPKAEIIGNLALVPWEVLHHSQDHKLKMKYLDFIKMQVERGDINASYLKAYVYKMQN